MSSVAGGEGAGQQGEPISRAALCVGMLALVLFFNGLEITSLPSFDDAYHAQTAKEMLRRGDFVTITYGGTPSFQSSPLPLWLMASSYSLFGATEQAARMPVALLALATVAAVYFFSRRLWGEAAGVVSAFILTTTPLFMRYSRHAMAEVPLAFFVTGAIFSLALAQADKRWYAGFGIGTGLAVLTKSALGLLPLLIAVPYLLLGGRARELAGRAFLGAAFLAAAIASLWYLPALILHGDRFIASHLGAYLGAHAVSGHHADLGVWGLLFYLVWLPVQYLPWSFACAPALVWGAMRLRSERIAPLLWLAVVLPVVLLSFVSSKYTRYLMPIFPSAAVLTAAFWVPRLRQGWSSGLQNGLAALSAAAAVLVMVLPIPLGEDRNDEIRALAAEVRRRVPEEAAVGNLRLSFFKYQNPLLFYADRRLAQPAPRPQALWAGLEPGQARFALAAGRGFEEAVSAAPELIEVGRVAESGELVLLGISRPGPVQWEEEIRGIAVLLPPETREEGKEFIANYKLPAGELEPLLSRITGRRLLDAEDKPRRLVRTMERRETTVGLAWRGAYRELREAPEDLPRFVPLAASERLVLFELQTINPPQH